MHSPTSSGIAFGVLFAVVGASFAYVGSNPFHMAGPVGISVNHVTPRIADALGLAEAKGLLITAVKEGSPADRAGLHAVQVQTVNGREVATSWDVIVAIDGKAVNNEEDVQLALVAKQAGDSVRFSVIRNGETINVNVTLD
ncbi:MAG: PDZ domain-containing protein [Nitrososphaera sp.]|jgi:S1-C subfamily serine protease